MGVFNHIGLVVRDLERSQHFYEQVLGFAPWYGDTIPDQATTKLLVLEPPLDVRVVYLTLDGFVLELLHYGAPGALPPLDASSPRTMAETGLSHLSVSVADIRATAQLAVTHGGAIVEESDVGVALLVRDPDGQLIELLTADYPSRRTQVPRPNAHPNEGND
jgi:catechol 2,3-dioxygenase-like lactoylglutathione lyase family enzyme